MYKIKLQQFEGPLDLLLFFIKRDELDIYNIPISQITKEFMEYLDMMENLNLEIAGDFILMASTLMQIKVRMLLPREKDEKGEEIDPREELVKALLEYKRYKEMTEEFSVLESEQRKVFYRGFFKGDEIEKPEELQTLLKNISVYDLLQAFKMAVNKAEEEYVHEIKKINVTVEEQMNFILDKIKKDRKISFVNLVTGLKEKIRIIVTFIAMLELVKLRKIDLRESESFNDFEIYGLENG
jgi:segregation and condensation protein A